MSTLAARQRGRQDRLARMTAQGKCFCGKVMDRVGARCSVCTHTKKLIARQRYRRSDYGFAFTRAVIDQGMAFALRSVTEWRR